MPLSIWNKLRKAPPEALRKIEAGRLKGKSDINPIWRYQAITELLGPCGVGWKYEIVKAWTEEAPENQRLVFVQLNFYYKHNGEWSEPIPGFGGDTVLVKEKSGIHLNDEAYKMATTDALGSSLKMLGVAADVYWEKGTTKYSRGAVGGEKPSANNKPVEGLVSEDQRRKMFATAKEARATTDDVKALITERFGYGSSSQLTTAECGEIIDYYEKQKQAQGISA
ncbi:MAG: hypothetical protein AAGU32_13085 [Bacillota bacterium]